MASVNVRFYAMLRSKAGSDGFSCAASTVRDVLREIERRFGPNIMRAVHTCSILVNSENVATRHGAATRLRDGDNVHVFPPLGGG